MSVVNKIEIEWDAYVPDESVQKAVTYLNKRTLEEILAELPVTHIHRTGRITFDYRVYSKHRLQDVDKIYVLLNGFAERAGTPDSGIKSLIADLILKQTETHNYAILVVGGLFSFSVYTRSKLMRQGYGAFAVITEGIADLLGSMFNSGCGVTVSGYSLGGVLAPLLAKTIDEKGIAVVDQVCCGEPSYVASSSTMTQLLKRVAHSTAYRNDQIRATAIRPYIAVKQTPDTAWAMFTYRAKQYRPLVLKALSMRFIVQDLAVQAHNHSPKTHDVQVKNALHYLAQRKIRVNLLHAEFSSLCHNEPFTELVESLSTIDSQLSVVTIRGEKADHGIEENRTLSAPFLIRPEAYWLVLK